MRKTMMILGVAAVLGAGSPAVSQVGDGMCEIYRQQGFDCYGMPLGQQAYPAPVSPQRYIQVGPNTYRNLDVTRPEDQQRVIIVPQRPQPMRRIH